MKCSHLLPPSPWPSFPDYHRQRPPPFFLPLSLSPKMLEALTLSSGAFLFFLNHLFSSFTPFPCGKLLVLKPPNSCPPIFGVGPFYPAWVKDFSFFFFFIPFGSLLVLSKVPWCCSPQHLLKNPCDSPIFPPATDFSSLVLISLGLLT